MSQQDPVDVLHAALLASEGGISAAAKAIGRSPGHLHNKFSEAMPHYEVSAREAIALAQQINCLAYAEAVCRSFGGVFVSLPNAQPSEDDVLQSYLDIIRQMGELSKEFTEARADGVLERLEFDSIQLRAVRTMSAIQHMIAELGSMVRDLPPNGTAPLKRVI
jgi:hypothetical protein